MNKVIGTTEALPTLKIGTHFNERADRFKDCTKNSKIEKIFVVEREGREQLFILLDNCTIIVVDKAIGRIVTVLNPREGQLKKLYQPLGMEVPNYLAVLSRTNNNGKYNA
ncbi:MAG: hypothetical protein ACRCTS_06950 [Fusobacteriaceae bacterium]